MTEERTGEARGCRPTGSLLDQARGSSLMAPGDTGLNNDLLMVHTMYEFLTALMRDH